jgi:hypothetical protein
MRCVFCKLDSTSSRSVEHIIPESLGNEDHVLKRGIVCDGCNNYFSREVEKPFLEYAGLRILRFNQWLPSKRGRIPDIKGVVGLNIPVTVSRDDNSTSIIFPEEAIGRLKASKGGTLYLPREGPIPEGRIVSRFLAKVALEAFVQRCGGTAEAAALTRDERQLDPLRDHARRGTTILWPTHARRVYDEDAMAVDPDGTLYQVVHEFDFLITEKSEWFFVLAIFGYEFAINIAGPAIDGYTDWLAAHQNDSPLYAGKNEASPKPTLSHSGDGFSAPVMPPNIDSKK